MDRDVEFGEFMRERWPVFVRSLVLAGCDLAEAEDVAQAAMLRCYLAWPKVQRARDPHAYAHRVLLNTWAKSRRRRWWGERPTESLPDAVVRGEEPEIYLVVVRALSKLSDAHRTVLVLRFVADLTETQVAEVLNIPVGTVKSRVARALAAVDLNDVAEETR